MVVFKSLLLFLLVFCFGGTYCKPAYDERDVAPGVWSRIWGWVAYVNPWGSPVDINETPPTPEHNSTQIKNPLVLEARQFTATTTYGNSTAALKSSSDQSAENEDPTTPIVSVQNAQISTRTEQQSLEASVASGQNNTTALEKSAADSREPNTSTIPVEAVQYNPTETEERVLEHHTEPILASTLIEQDISPTTEELTIEPAGLKTSTTPIVLDSINPITTQGLVVDQTSERQVSTTDQNIRPPKEELLKEQPLNSEVITPSFILDIGIYASALDTPTISEDSATDYPSEPEAYNTTIAMDQNILKTREEPVTKQTLELDVTTIFIVPHTDIPTTEEEPLISETSTYVSALGTPIGTEKPMIDPSKSKLSTTPIAIDLDFLTSTNKPTMGQLFGFESPTTASALNNPTTEEPAAAADDPMVPETTTTDQNNTIITKETATEMGELSLKMKVLTDKIYIQSTLGDGAQFPYGLLIPTKPDPLIFGRVEGSIKMSEMEPGKDKAREISEGPILTEFVTDSYPGVAVAMSERDEEAVDRGETWILSESSIDQYLEIATPVTGREEESVDESRTLIFLNTTVEPDGRDDEPTERSKISTLTEPATGMHPEVVVAVLGRDGNSTEGSEVTILTEPVTSFYTGVDVAVSKEKVSTEHTKVSKLIETDNLHLHKELQEVSVWTVADENQFLEAEKASTRAIEESMNVNGAFTVVSDVQAMSTGQDGVVATRVSRSHSAGYQLSYYHRRFMFIFYALSIFYESLV